MRMRNVRNDRYTVTSYRTYPEILINSYNWTVVFLK